MKCLFIVLAIALTVIGYPMEIDDVLLIDPVNTNSKDAGGNNETGYDGLIPIIIIRTRPKFTGFGYDYGLFDSEESEDYGNDENAKPTGLSKEEASSSLCGIICLLLKNLQTQLKTFEENFNSTSNSSDNPDSPNVFNSTYTEKVLPDGSIVKINRTFVLDTSDNGNSFFFHSTSFHNVGDTAASYEELEDDEEEDSFEHEFTPIDEEKTDSEAPKTEKKVPSVDELSPGSDDKENEIDAGKSKTDERLVRIDAAQ